MKHCLELLRVSTLGQADADRASLPSQRTVNRQTAERYGLTIVRTVEMAGVSGAAVLLAPEMQEMIRLMQAPDIHGVITREFSRLMRPENFADYALLQSFVDSNTILYLPEGPIDFSSDSGIILGTVHAALGGIERRQMKKKIWAAKEEKRRGGELAQSYVCLPFGVACDGNLWRYTPESERIKEAFRLFLSGSETYASIGEAVGIRPLSLRVMFRNPIYTGWRVIDKKRDPSAAGQYPRLNGRQGDRRKITRSPEEVIRVQVIHDPLISEADFNRVQQMMDLKRLKHSRINSKASHRFTYNSFLNCFCGATLYAKAFGVDYYACKDKCGLPFQRRDRLEPLLHSIFGKRLTSPLFLKRHVMPAVKGLNKSKGDSGAMRQQLQTLNAKRQRILDTYFEGVITLGDRDARITAVDRDRAALTAILTRDVPRMDLTLDTLVRSFEPFVEFDLLSRDDKRRLLNIVQPQITVSKYEVKGMSIFLNNLRVDEDDYGAYRLYFKLALKAA